MSNGNKKNHSNFFYTGIRSTIWTASNIRRSSRMVILQLRPTKFNSLILIVYYIYTPYFSKRLFSSLFFKKSGEFHDNKNYRVYVKKPHHHLIYISSKFIKHHLLLLKKLGNPESSNESSGIV